MLSGKTLELRALELADVDLLYNWENDSKLWHLSNTVVPFSRFTLEQYILNAEQDVYSSKQLRLMIDKKSGGKRVTIGTIDIFDFDPANKRAGLGILIVEKERKKGYASEALEILMDYCFQVLHLHQLYCNISVGNDASMHLFKKNGFTEVGKKKDWLHIRNTWVDEIMLQKISNN